MNSSLYTATSGLLREELRLTTVANNLANARSDGFRPQRTFVESYLTASQRQEPSLASLFPSVRTAATYASPGRGPLEPTGRALDVALPDEHFFAVETPAGVRYTRLGELSVDDAGRLIDHHGNPLLDADGDPLGELEQDVVIDGEGSLSVDGAPRGKVAIYRGELSPVGEGLYEGNPQRVDDAKLTLGFLERSAVDAVQELVRLIESQRAFERYQRVISLTMNDVNRRAVSEIAGNR